MADPFKKVNGARLTFKGGDLATRSKTIDKAKKKKKKKSKKTISEEEALEHEEVLSGDAGGSGEVYTIDAAKRMKYDQLFPVEAKKFGYDPKTTSTSVEEALDDRVKKKADRYCK